jgi:hypothetical protein
VPHVPNVPLQIERKFRHFKVLLSKRLARFKYDYREEWLRLIDNLSSTASPLSLPERAVMALAKIIESPGGALFVQEDEGRCFVPAASWSEGDEVSIPWQELPRDDLMAHMETQAWIVDSDEPLPIEGDAHFLLRLVPPIEGASFSVPSGARALT